MMINDSYLPRVFGISPVDLLSWLQCDRLGACQELHPVTVLVLLPLRLMLLSQIAETIPTGTDVVAKDVQHVYVEARTLRRINTEAGLQPSLYTSAAPQCLSDDLEHHQNVKMFTGPLFFPKNHVIPVIVPRFVCVCVRVFTRACMCMCCSVWCVRFLFFHRFLASPLGYMCVGVFDK